MRLNPQLNLKSKDRSSLIFLFVLLFGIVIRSIAITRPLLGNFGVYGTAQGMIARFFQEGNFLNIFRPQVNEIVNGQPSLILLYYPVSSLLAALFDSFLGGSLDLWGRLQAVIFFALSCFFLFRFVAELLNTRAALVCTIAFSLSPLTVIYGQSFQNEMATVFFTIGFFFYFVKHLKNKTRLSFALAALLMSGVLITRPNNIYLFFPALYLSLFIYRIERRFLWSALKTVLLCFFFALLLPTLWYFYIWHLSVSENNIYSTMYEQFLLRSRFASPLVFQFAYYQELFDSVAGIVLTPIGLTLFGLGTFFCILSPVRYGFAVFWSYCFLVTSMLIPQKLIEHNFYLLHFVLPASLVIGQCSLDIFDAIQMNQSRKGIVALFFIFFAFGVSMRYALHPAFVTPHEQKNITALAEKVREFTDKSDRVIVQGTFELLYYADRYGWSFTLDRKGEVSDRLTKMNWQKLPEDKWKKRNEAYRDEVSALEYLKNEEGATHFVVTIPAQFYRNKRFSQHMMKNYRLAYQDRDYGLVFDLTT